LGLPKEGRYEEMEEDFSKDIVLKEQGELWVLSSTKP
jgi:hypothetical protein